VAAAILGGTYLALVATGVSRIGMGDVRLAALTGLLLGTDRWQTVLLGASLPYLLALPIAVASATRNRGITTGQLPFGPFLIAATIIARAMTGKD
jgi:leader peptidase (prepilin peptidase)/N-methyltransferase